LSIRLRKIIVEHVVTTGPGCAVRRAAELMNEHARARFLPVLYRDVYVVELAV
jgi:hypothetical protein